MKVGKAQRHWVLQAVFDAFRDSSEWPSAREMDLKLGSVVDMMGGLQAACIQIGSDAIMCGSPYSEAEVCRLRLAGLLQCDGAAEDLARLLKAFRYCGKKYSEEHGRADVSEADFVNELRMTADQARRVALMLEDLPRVWTGGQKSASGERSFRLGPFCRKLTGVESIADFRRLLATEESPPTADVTSPPVAPTVERRGLFLCHAVTDRLLAQYVRRWLPDLDVFMASRPGDIPPGTEWLGKIQSELRAADTYLVLLTPNSIDRPWVWFESGAAWMTERRLVPTTAGGLSVGQVPYPLAAFQVLSLENPDEAEAVFGALGQPLPRPSQFAQKVRKLAAGAVDQGRVERGWSGIQSGRQFYAWAGPLEALQDRDPCVSSRRLESDLVRAGCDTTHVLRRRLAASLDDGWLPVFLTDGRSWRRIVESNNHAVLVVRPHPSA
jgi:hypothetical protein